jgi:flagellar biosynthesis/type III secretory pathway protein FliH
LIKASNNKKINEAELKVKKNENESFKKVTLHDIAKQSNQKIKEKIIEKNKKNNLNQSKPSEEEKENIEEKKDDNKNNEIIENKENNEEINTERNASINNEDIKTEDKKIFYEDEHLKLLEEEKKLAYEKGKTDALNEVKEGSDAAIAQLKKVIESISKVEELDLKIFEKNINLYVIDIVNNLTGKIIEELPKEFIKQIKDLLSQLENIEGNIAVYINERDYKVIESNKNIKNEIKKLSSISPGFNSLSGLILSFLISFLIFLLLSITL